MNKPNVIEQSQDVAAGCALATGSANIVIEVQAEPPTECRWTNGCSTPLKGWAEKPLRDYAEWMRREIIKAGGYSPNDQAQRPPTQTHEND